MRVPPASCSRAESNKETTTMAWSRSTVLLACLLTACAVRDGSGPDVEPAPSARATEGQRTAPIRRLAQILRAEDRRVVDDALIDAAGDGDATIRARAALALGRIADPRERDRLESLLADDEDAAVRASAAFALGVAGDRAAAPALVAAAEDPEPLVRSRVATALGVLAEPPTQATVIALLADPDAEVAADAARAIARFPGGDEAVPALVALSRSDEPQRVQAAVYGLSRMTSTRGRLGYEVDREARDALVALAESDDPEVRLRVAEGLAVASLPTEGELLGRMFREDPDFRVRMAAIASLSFPGAPIEPFVGEALRSDEERLVFAAVSGLERMRGGDILDAAALMIIHDDRPWIRLRAVEALPKIDADAAARMAEGLSKDHDLIVRAASVAPLVGRDDDHAIAIGKRLADDEFPRVRAAAYPVLAVTDIPLRELPHDPLHHPDVVVRTSVARAAKLRLEREETPPALADEALAVLDELWEQATDDEIPLVRTEVLAAAAQAGDRGRSLLRRGLDDPNREVRMQAVEHLRDVHGEDHAEVLYPATDLPLEHYERVLRWAETPRAAIVTVGRTGFAPGRFTLRLDTENAPLTAWNFAQLAERGFYRNLMLHRVVPNFVVQDGDPLGTGEGGPGYTIRDEVHPEPFWAGTVGMATAGKDTGGSQWFVTLTDTPHLDGRYTAFGSIVQNFVGVVLLLAPGDDVLSIEVYEGDGTEPLPPLDLDDEAPAPAT
jgi:cyclophilin family peptidyl-prolyl cis-trans isomerase/HEAT repeat protein